MTHVLSNGARLWMEATIEQMTGLQPALFPEGLRFRNGKIGTAVTCMAFTQLRKMEDGKSDVASPTGRTITYEAGNAESYELPLAGTVRKAA